MKVQAPAKLNRVTTAAPVDLAAESGNAVVLGSATGSPTVVYDRSLWFSGEGPPPAADTIGAKNGDCYLDSLTGDVYKLVV
jgi:hypothetical protein